VDAEALLPEAALPPAALSPAASDPALAGAAADETAVIALMLLNGDAVATTTPDTERVCVAAALVEDEDALAPIDPAAVPASDVAEELLVGVAEFDEAALVVTDPSTGVAAAVRLCDAAVDTGAALELGESCSGELLATVGRVGEAAADGATEGAEVGGASRCAAAMAAPVKFTRIASHMLRQRGIVVSQGV